MFLLGDAYRKSGFVDPHSSGLGLRRSSLVRIGPEKNKSWNRQETPANFCRFPCFVPSDNGIAQVIELRKFATPILPPASLYLKRRHRAVSVRAQKLTIWRGRPSGLRR